MITPDQFTKEALKLQDQFGASRFSQRKSELIYLAVRHLSLGELTKIVDDFIGNAKFAPTLNDFKSAASRYVSEKPNSDKVPCDLCNTSGIVLVRKKTGELGEYAFQCRCVNGRPFRSFIPWNDGYQKFYTRQNIPIELTRKFYSESKEKLNESCIS